MKTFPGLVLIGLTLVPTMPAQTETFDISTFVRPAGWNRSESNGVLILQDRKSVAGGVQFCQIYLFPNVASSQDAAANFQQEWEAKVVRSLGISVRPSPQSETTPDGWTAVTGVADAMRQGLPVRTVLVTATGFGKFVSVLVTVSPNSYISQIEQFFKDLNFKSNAGAPPARPGADQTAEGPDTKSGVKTDPGPAGSLDSYTFSAPLNWTREQARDRIVLTSPMYSNGERCQLSLLPLR